MLICLSTRLEVQHTVRQLGRSGGNANEEKIQRLRDALATLTSKMKAMQCEIGAVDVHSAPVILDDETLWDEEGDDDGIMADSIVSSGLPGPASAPQMTPIERQVLALPSNGNVPVSFAPMELTQRVDQAANILNRLRDLIADKSFQYSHVMRDAPTKKVRTRAQTKVKALNADIMVHCRMYSRCRARLVLLGADNTILRKFQPLTKQDVKASSAVLNPNIPGGSRLQLSWIWSSSYSAQHSLVAMADAVADADADHDPSAVLECQ